MNSTKIKNHHRKNHLAKIVTLAIAAILIVGGIAYAVSRNNSQDSTGNTPVPASDKDAGSNDGEKTKEDIAKEQNAQADNGKKQVEPAIVFAGKRNGQIEVRSYVDGVYETNGKCTATFTKGSEKLTRTVKAYEDAAYTGCNRVVISPEEFPSTGTWSLTVSYSSPTASGTSESRQVEIQ